ncbi:MAG: alanine racemase [Proteobacteria bacterium]|nr:alanine racemase [Pseudomonadota bacterium]
MPRYSDSRLIIDLNAIAANYSSLKKRAKHAEAAAVVKADAYGLGAAKVAPFLEKKGCEHFFVATLDEAITLRNIIKKHPIYVFHGIGKHEASAFITHRLIPVLNHPEQARLWQLAAKKANKKLPAILHVDTGMHRLGFSYDELEGLKAAGLDIRYIMSHLACANDASHPMNREQLKRMNAARKVFPMAEVSLSNSAGVFLDSCFHFDLVRPGIALYGSSPTDKPNIMKPVVQLKARIIELQTLQAKEAVGYGATRILPKGTVLATLPVGYADGYLRALSNTAEGYIHGKHVPLVGRVSMDLIVLDVTDIQARVKLGDEVELMGSHITIDDLAAKAGTIGYEILTRLGDRFIREYKG